MQCQEKRAEPIKSVTTPKLYIFRKAWKTSLQLLNNQALILASHRKFLRCHRDMQGLTQQQKSNQVQLQCILVTRKNTKLPNSWSAPADQRAEHLRPARQALSLECWAWKVWGKDLEKEKRAACVTPSPNILQIMVRNSALLSMTPM